jgi:hypothetical protein
VSKREEKEEPEYATPSMIRRRGNTIREPARQQQRCAGDTLLVPKPKLKEEQDDKEAAKAA